MSDDIQVLDYSYSPSGSASSPALGRPSSSKSPATVTAHPSKPSTPQPSTAIPSGSQANAVADQTKYGALLTVIEELGRDIRPTYVNNKLAAERLKRGIVHARLLARECISECDKINRSNN